MDKNARIYVAGHRGLVGSAIVRKLEADGYTNILKRTHAELDLTDAAATNAFFAQDKPEYVFLAAAKVGGILANTTYPNPNRNAVASRPTRLREPRHQAWSAPYHANITAVDTAIEAAA